MIDEITVKLPDSMMHKLKSAIEDIYIHGTGMVTFNEEDKAALIYEVNRQLEKLLEKEVKKPEE